MEATVLNLKGKETGKINLPQQFETKASPALLHEVTVGYLANMRSGTHSTKTRAEVSGSNKKPWRQKGTGRARSGSTRSPLWRKGGITFGPKPRDYFQKISQKKRKLALNMVLSEKLKEGNLIVLDEIKVSEPKTKKMVEVLKNIKVDNSKVLIAVDKLDKNLKIASRNIPDLIVTEARNLNAYQVLWAKKLVFNSKAVEQL